MKYSLLIAGLFSLGLQAHPGPDDRDAAVGLQVVVAGKTTQSDQSGAQTHRRVTSDPLDYDSGYLETPCGSARRASFGPPPSGESREKNSRLPFAIEFPGCCR